jgi:hypothetical protein
MSMKIVEVWTDSRGWVPVSIERDHDRAFDAAKETESRLSGIGGKDVRVAIRDANTGITNWMNR